MSRLTIEDTPGYFRAVLERISDLFARPIVVDHFDDEWVHFHLPGIADRYALTKIEANRDAVLPREDFSDLRVLCASNSCKEPVRDSL